MPLPFFSTDGIFGGAYSRMRGLILSGELGSTNPGPISPVGGVAVIQPALVCSTLGPAAQVLSTVTGTLVGANFIYIPQSTGAISTSSYAAAQNTPPQTGMGAAIVWNAGASKLAIYSTVAGGWMYTAALTSSA